jgi:hypothetical protein
MQGVDWVTVVVSIAINTPAVAGLLGWLGKRRLARELADHNERLEGLRARYATELEIYRSSLETSKQLLQAEIDRTVLVSRVHFETEFDALKQVFAKLSEIRLQIPALRPHFGVVPADDTKDAKLERLADALSKIKIAYNELLSISENLSPFYPPEIYAQVDECREATWIEMTDIETTNPNERFSSVWYAEGERNQRRFRTAYTQVSSLIRVRISKLAIMREA